MAAVSAVSGVSDPYTDALLGNYKWSSSTISFSFPAVATAYASSNETQTNFAGLDPWQQNAARSVFAQYSAVANLTFVEQTGASASSATIRLASTDYTSTAFAYLPSTSDVAGDVWFNNSSSTYDQPRKGNYAFATFLHEIGHALGLLHPHENGMPADRDSMEYTVMSYNSFVGSQLGYYVNEFWSFSQSLMMYDIAAVQSMYGANYSVNSTDTVYSWDPRFSEVSVNGSARSAQDHNRIFQTIWDGGGVDTYDFSAYTTRVNADLEPGAWTTASTNQLARLHYDGSQVARGNIANALQYNGDIRSLIENAVGGSAGDVLRGNSAANNLRGRQGDDDLYGRDGNDTLNGEAGNDYIDGGAGMDVAIYGQAAGNYRVYRDGIYWVVQDLRAGSPEGSDYLIDVETLRMGGTDVSLASFASPIIGNAQSNRLIGTNYNDVIEGLGADDDLYGREGDDTLTGGAGNDYIDGESGADRAVYSGNASDYNVSRDGVYWVVKDLRGGSPDGTDYLVNVETFGFADGDRAPTVSPIVGDGLPNRLVGGAGDDFISALGGDDDLYGNGGNDRLSGGAGSDYIEGGAGQDVSIYSGNSSDYRIYRDGVYWVVQDLRGGAPEGTDYLVGTETARFADRDVALAPPGSTITGNSSANLLSGTADDDFIFGYGGDDDLYGRNGSDTLVGGAGNDYLDGGPGRDFASYSGNASDYSITSDGPYRVVRDLRAGSPDGTDYLINVEALQFANGETPLAAQPADDVSHSGNEYVSSEWLFV